MKYAYLNGLPVYILWLKLLIYLVEVSTQLQQRKLFIETNKAVWWSSVLIMEIGPVL